LEIRIEAVVCVTSHDDDEGDVLVEGLSQDVGSP
jgi:hypothetical protein